MSFILDRGETTDVSESEERELRESLSDWMTASGSNDSLLHVPHDLEDDKPLCNPVTHPRTTWKESPTEVYPMGHSRVCPACTERFFRQIEQGIR